MAAGLRITVEVPVPDNIVGDPMALSTALANVDANINKTLVIHKIREFNITHAVFAPWVWTTPQYVLPDEPQVVPDPIIP